MRGEGEVSKEKSCVEKKFSLAKLRGYNNIAKGRGKTKGSSVKVYILPNARTSRFKSVFIFSRFLPNRPRPLSSFDTHARWAARKAKLSISMILRKK